MKRPQFEPLKPKVALGIAAHADDLDFGAGGTLAAYARDGCEVHYLIITDGCKGSADPNISPASLIKTRQNEQRAAADIIGVKSVEFLDYPDGELEVTMALKRQLAKVIRIIKPDVVITIDPSMIYAASYGSINHPDHRAAGQATLDAVFPLARDHLNLPELLAAGYPPHKTPTVLLINLEHSNFCVDITDTFDTKMAAILAHASQFANQAETKERAELIATSAGQQYGHKLAESFMRIDIR
ncbi:MAG TPA: PIG-L deacetylase family protein [Candidatus Limnocylindrales bacterium]|nr:PIG-L deacetylase family protein [Candidatus Limnocylindrales bacterium]